MNLIIAGMQGSGKGTHAKKLAKELKITHISFGDTLKKCLKDDPELVSPYTIENYNNGELAPDEILFKVADKYITEAENKGGFILDGFPRTKPQMDYLLENWTIDKCLYLDITKQTAIKRLKKRGRSDDTESGIRRRLDQFNNITKPIFIEMDINKQLTKVDANPSAKAVYAHIKSKIIDTDTENQ